MVNEIDEYEEALDEVSDQYDTSQDLSDAQLDSYSTYPTTKEKSDLYNWFWKVTDLGKLGGQEDETDSLKVAKVGNMTTQEIGDHGVPVREALNLAMLSDIFKHPKFGEYWRSRSIVNSTSSMSKKGWFMDLSISQKKVRERSKSGNPSANNKWRFFNKRETQTEQ